MGGYSSHIKEFQRQTGLDKVEIKQIRTVFLKHAVNGELDHEAFRLVLHELTQFGVSEIAHTPLADRLFQCFDTNSDGTVNINEFFRGVTFLAAGDPEQKLELTFQAYDVDGSGTIETCEILGLFVETYEALLKTLRASDLVPEWRDIDSPEEHFAQLIAAFRTEAERLITSTVRQFSHDGGECLTLAEFKRFALMQPKVTASMNGLTVEVPMTLLSEHEAAELAARLDSVAPNDAAATAGAEGPPES